MQNILERELTEKNRQSGLMRQYFDGKRAAFDARQEKFLRMYPYHGASCGADLRRFASWIYRCAESACPVFWKSPVRKEGITVPDKIMNAAETPS